ncbi:hypothetical protein [Mangrovibacterium lignilyticum]|uniref:hypothetical protein n=1 Tax=Mangrovibacterium lignilyticum TaxID=2668052 RepID=UPI0013D7C455|nr:hypothetical protein [Mangrovibacterium lignilyticum]
MEQLDWIGVLKRRYKASGWSIQKVAGKTGMTYSGVWQLLKRNDVRLQRLVNLSEAFQYNFLRELAEQLPYSEPEYRKEPAEIPVAETSEADKRVMEELAGRVKELELELRVLKEAIVLMRGPVA